MVGIYKIICLKNGKVYIGQSINLKKRMDTHIQLLSKGIHPNCHLQKDFNLYGKNCFCCEPIEIVDNKIVGRDLLSQLEVKYINLYNSTNRDFGYNIEEGGFNIGPQAIETREKLSISNKGKNKGRIISEHTRQLMKQNNSHYWKGKTHSKETKQKLSQIRKGKPSHWKGKKQTKEHIEKRAKTQIGKVWVNNGVISRFVTKEECDNLLTQGFVVGRCHFARNTGKYEYKGKKCSLCEISRMCGIDRSVLFYRLKRGWSMEKATTVPVKK